MPVDPADDAPNVADQENDPNSLLNRTRQLIALRHSEPALANYAEFVPLYAEKDTYPFVYARAAGEEVVLVLLNPRAEASEAVFNVNVPFRKTRLLMGDEIELDHDRKTGNVSVKMPGQSYSIIKLL